MHKLLNFYSSEVTPHIVSFKNPMIMNDYGRFNNQDAVEQSAINDADEVKVFILDKVREPAASSSLAPAATAEDEEKERDDEEGNRKRKG